MPWKISYRWPNPFFLIWDVVALFLAAFFYYCGKNLIAIAHQLLLGYMAYGVMAGFLMLAVLPYLLGLEMTYVPKPRTEEEVAEPADNTPVGNSYFVPLVGYLLWQLPNLVHRRRWIILLENTALYSLVGLANGLLGYRFTIAYAFALAIAVVVEYFLYYRRWMPSMAVSKHVDRKSTALAYLVTQEHAFAFLALGWVVGLLLH